MTMVVQFKLDQKHVPMLLNALSIGIIRLTLDTFPLVSN